MKSIGDSSYFEEARELKNEINIIVRAARHKYINDKLAAVKSSAQAWKIIDELIQYKSKSNPKIAHLKSENGLSIKNDSDICEKLANEFIVKNSISDVDLCNEELDKYTLDYNSKIEDQAEEVFNGHVPNVHAIEIQDAITYVEKSADGKDNIPLKLYKRFSEIFSIPLSILFINIFTIGIVPENFKNGHAIALYKNKGSRFLSSSYRAIFNFPFIVKVFERILHNKLLFAVKDLLDDSQHGFRSNRSCQTAIGVFTQYIHNALNKKKGKGVALYIDFSKAFDSISNEKLIRKLMKNFKGKIPPYIIKTLISYFKDRTFTITNGEYVSKKFKISSGVPPGSISGNLLYTLYINEIGSVINLPYTLYCDDLAIYTECNSFVEGTQILNECLNKFNTWCISNYLKINVSKTKYMVFYKSRDYRSAEEEKGEIYLNGEHVELVSCFKYLGIHLNSNLSYKEHCENINVKLNAALGKMYTIKRAINVKFLKSVLSAYIISILDFGIQFWVPGNQVFANKFQSKINKYVMSYFYPQYTRKWYKKDKKQTTKYKKVDINPLLNKLSSLTIKERNIITCLKFVFKMQNVSIFKDLFVCNRLSGRGAYRCQIPIPQCSLFQNSMQYTSNKIWND